MATTYICSGTVIDSSLKTSNTLSSQCSEPWQIVTTGSTATVQIDSSQTQYAFALGFSQAAAVLLFLYGLRRLYYMIPRK